jgi:hypothetical protein
MTVTLVVSIPTADAYKSNPKAVDDALAGMAKAPGLLEQYVGEQVESGQEETTVVWIFSGTPPSLLLIRLTALTVCSLLSEWESESAYTAFTQSDLHAPLAQIGKDLAHPSAPASARLFPFAALSETREKGTAAALAHPITEVATYQVSSAENGKRLEEFFGTIGSFMPASAFASSTKDESVKCLLVGWPSVEARVSFVWICRGGQTLTLDAGASASDRR